MGVLLCHRPETIGDTMDCPRSDCTASNMTPEQFATHIVGHGDGPSEHKLKEDKKVGGQKQSKRGRK